MDNQDEEDETKRNAFILRNPEKGKTSELYRACRNGDINVVRHILSARNLSNLNQLELNGSTALHAASFYGHTEIVRLLIEEYDVFRHQVNRYGKTAYEEAATDEIRQLFYRPSNNNRYCNDDTEDFFITSTNDRQQDEDNSEASNDWLYMYNNETEVRNNEDLMLIVASQTCFRRILKPFSRFMEFMNHDEYKKMDILPFDEAEREIEKAIDKYIPSNNLNYNKARKCFSTFKKTKQVEELIRLYTLETPFYKNMDAKEAIIVPILLKIYCLETRAYQGLSFRGLYMTKEDFQSYKWAWKDKERLIVVKHLCSSSVEKEMAQMFCASQSGEKMKVLMVFKFPKLCSLAIQLYAVQDKFPNISEFEEDEVLILPMVMFRVTNIEEAPDMSTIYLENVLPNLGLLPSINRLMCWFYKTHIRGITNAS